MENHKFQQKYNVIIRPNRFRLSREAIGIWCLCFALLCQSNLYAQSEDFELWKGIELKKAWGKDLTFSFEEQVRLNNNVSQFKSAFLDGGVRYELLKQARISLGYRYTVRLKSVTQRLYSDLSLKLDRKWLVEPVFRLRYQEDYKRGDLPERKVRPKLSLKTGIKPLKLDISLAGELFYELSSEGSDFNRYRLGLGFSRPLASRSSVTLNYLFQEEFNVRDPLTSSVISLSYSVSLNDYDLEARRRLPRVKR